MMLIRLHLLAHSLITTGGGNEICNRQSLVKTILFFVQCCMVVSEPSFSEHPQVLRASSNCVLLADLTRISWQVVNLHC